MTKAGFGEQLKREREMRGVSLDEICTGTRIATRFLEALENEDWERLPGGVFNRGFVRSVARFLGLDEENLLAEYTLAMSEFTGTPAWTSQHPPAPPPTDWPVNPQRTWLPVVGLVLAVLLLAGGGWFGWRSYREHRRQRLSARLAAAEVVTKAPPVPADAAGSGATELGPPSPAAPLGASPTSSQPSAPLPAVTTGSGTAPGGSAPVVPTNPPATPSSPKPAEISSGLQLKIAAEKDTTLTISADGKKTYKGPIAAGHALIFAAHGKLNVRADDAGAVALELNGQTLAPIGKPGKSGKVTLTRKDLKPTPGGDH